MGRARKQIQVLAIVLVIALSISASALAVTEAKLGGYDPLMYEDYDEVVYQEAFSQLVKLGMITGTQSVDADSGSASGEVSGTETAVSYYFYPSEAVTRGEMCMMIAMACNLVPDRDIWRLESDFEDVPEGYWADAMIAYCVENGITNGSDDGLFRPDDPCTGYEAAEMLLRAMSNGLGIGVAATQEEVESLAVALGLMEELSAVDMAAELTKDGAAQMVYNAMRNSEGGDADGDSENYYVGLPKLVVIYEDETVSDYTIEENTYFLGKPGYSVVLTSDHKEIGMVFGNGGDVPGTFDELTFTLSPNRPEEYKSTLVHFWRQGIIANENGYDEEASIVDMISEDTTVFQNGLTGGGLVSEGDDFGTFYIKGYTSDWFTAEAVDFISSGNGSNDFVGFGANVTVDNSNVKFLNCTLYSQGATNNALILKGGANVIMENSVLTGRDGPLPDDYIINGGLGFMRSAPWHFGLSGNNRAANILGEGSRLTLIETVATSNSWGILSVDDCQEPFVTLINSLLLQDRVPTYDGLDADIYGTYIIGNAVISYLGTDADLDGHVIIGAGGTCYIQDATEENIRTINELGNLGLDADTIAAQATEKGNTLYGSRSIVMNHSAATNVYISGHSILLSDSSVFLYKGAPGVITADGSDGLIIESGKNVLLQVMDNDKPSSTQYYYRGNRVQGYGQSDYIEPYASADEIEAVETYDRYSSGDDAVVMELIHFAELTGDCWNACSGFVVNRQANARTMVVTLSDTNLIGNISAAFCLHATTDENGELVFHDRILVPSNDINPGVTESFREIGEVVNYPSPAVNNGVLVTVTDGSVWTLTDTCYLTGITIDIGSSVTAVEGKTVVMRVNGVVTPLEAGSYSGDIILSVE